MQTQDRRPQQLLLQCRHLLLDLTTSAMIGRSVSSATATGGDVAALDRRAAQLLRRSGRRTGGGAATQYGLRLRCFSEGRAATAGLLCRIRPAGDS